MALEQSRKYASEYNEVVRGYQADMDERLIGKWVNTTGVALNGTLNEFYDDVKESKSSSYYVIDKGPANAITCGTAPCVLGQNT